MVTRAKTNAEFRNDVNDMLARHESNLGQVNTTLEKVLTELQALRTSRSPTIIQTKINPFAHSETSHLHPSRSHNTNDHSRQHLKLAFPRFNGDDPNGWIYKAEQYFDFKNIVPDQQVQLASFHLEGIALQWHRWMTKFRGPLTWVEFTRAVSHRFGPTDYEYPSKALTRLKQTTTVAAYQKTFEKLSHQVDGLPEGFLIGCFIAGLRDNIHLDVKIKKPSSLADTIGVARRIEERNQLQKKQGQPFLSQMTPTKATTNNTAGVL